MEHQLSDAGEGAIPVRAGLLLASVRVASRHIVSWGTGSSRSSSMQRASRRVVRPQPGTAARKRKTRASGQSWTRALGGEAWAGGGGRAARREEAVAGRMTHGDGGRWVANLDERRRAFQSR